MERALLRNTSSDYVTIGPFGDSAVYLARAGPEQFKIQFYVPLNDLRLYVIALSRVFAHGALYSGLTVSVRQTAG